MKRISLYTVKELRKIHEGKDFVAEMCRQAKINVKIKLNQFYPQNNNDTPL